MTESLTDILEKLTPADIEKLKNACRNFRGRTE